MIAVLERGAAVRFAAEIYSTELVQEMRPMWWMHYEEIAHYKDIPLDPDLHVYTRLWQAGHLRIYTARLGTGDDSYLAGYNVFIVMNHPHYQTSKQANQDILWLDPEMRKGLIGVRFLRWCDEQLKAEGVQVVMQHMKIARDHTAIMKRLGYEPMDTIFVKRLDREE